MRKNQDTHTHKTHARTERENQTDSLHGVHETGENRQGRRPLFLHRFVQISLLEAQVAVLLWGEAKGKNGCLEVMEKKRKGPNRKSCVKSQPEEQLARAVGDLDENVPLHRVRGQGEHEHTIMHKHGGARNTQQSNSTHKSTDRHTQDKCSTQKTHETNAGHTARKQP